MPSAAGEGSSLLGEAKRGDGVRYWQQSQLGGYLERRSTRRSRSLLLYLPWRLVSLFGANSLRRHGDHSASTWAQCAIVRVQ